MPDYGNVPDDDVQAIQDATRIAVRSLTQLPADAPPAWREIAYEVVLNGILHDWVVNGTNDLDDDDTDDVANLLRMAADAALSQEEPLRDVTFRVVLKNVMNDWVENWNLDE